MVLFAECLELQADQFQATSVKIRRKMWWKNMKVSVIYVSFFTKTINVEVVGYFFG